MQTSDDRKMTLLAPCIPLTFLVRPYQRAKKPKGMEEASESACFYRLHELFWPMLNDDAMTLLDESGKNAVAEFERVFKSMPWQTVDGRPDLKELAGDDLAPLIPVGEKLLEILEAKTAG